jgi:hypothetical protein
MFEAMHMSNSKILSNYHEYMGSKEEEVIEGQGKLHNWELHDLYPS